jgi:hypothetical protein
MGQHRSAQVISPRVAKESMTGFAPATTEGLKVSPIKARSSACLNYYTTRTFVVINDVGAEKHYIRRGLESYRPSWP